MTTYELADLSQSFFGNSIAAYAVFLTIVSGYLATAYVVGARLSVSQVRLLTTLFVLVMFFLIWTMSAYVYWGVEFALGAINAGTQAGIMKPSIWVPVVFAVLNLFTAAMCLVFMWNVRRSQTGSRPSATSST